MESTTWISRYIVELFARGGLEEEEKLKAGLGLRACAGIRWLRGEEAIALSPTA